MSSTITSVITVPPASATVLDRLNLHNGNIDAPQSFAHLGNYIEAIGGGTYIGSAIVEVGAVAAAGLITFSSFANTNTITIGTTVLTGSSTLQDTTHFKIGASDTATAANAVTTILANSTLSKFVTATSGTGTVLVTAIVPGYAGNFIPLAISTNGSVSGSVLGTGTGSVAGSNGTVYTFSVGL